ncbi:DUF2798 domain-containing protein [Wolinella succinogenes]|nr:DUF2798 domain-containing protein [Wolinella succinogenes]VEG80897.1 Protein of uncharacterised function (DUF2798) [Wolinella succinogenes]HCZ18576.1 DUF2798 domain-containing protein [Helicobacter sp.]
MFPRRFHSPVFALLMSLIMSFFMSGVITMLNIGLVSDFFYRWLAVAFPGAFIVAFPIALFVVPIVKRLTERLMRD